LVKASKIDWANVREVLNELKKLDGNTINPNNTKIEVTQKSKNLVCVKFFYALDCDRGLEEKKVNSYFLDRGFKRFTLNVMEDSNEFIIGTLFKTFKPLK
jgi:hypothetical protein